MVRRDDETTMMTMDDDDVIIMDIDDDHGQVTTHSMKNINNLTDKSKVKETWAISNALAYEPISTELASETRKCLTVTIQL